jgi:hypothetical protein
MRRLLPRTKEQPSRHVGFHRKQTRHWCKGKVGTPHQFEWVRWLDLGVHWYSDGRSITWYIEKCRACGRHGRFQTVQRILINEGSNAFRHMLPDGTTCELWRPDWPATAAVCPCREYEVHWQPRVDGPPRPRLAAELAEVWTQ